MADDPLDTLRLSLMQDILPVGMAIFKRARKGGPSSVVEAFAQSEDPFLDLRKEGEDSAKSLRDQLDQVSPGLGNPVVSVDVQVDDQVPGANSQSEQEMLSNVLTRIELRLSLLEHYLDQKLSLIHISEPTRPY